MDKFQNRYRIPSARASWHNYDGGIYFITICTKNKAHYFGEIVDAPIVVVETPHCDVSTTTTNDMVHQPYMQLTEIGKFTDICIHQMDILHDDITVPLYQIMPNHIHMIIIVEKTIKKTLQCDVSTPKNKNMQHIANQCGRLSHVISRFKYAVTHFAHENGIDFAWQTRFYDRIVRDQNELNRIAEYIENNVITWKSDELTTIEPDK